MNGQNSDDAAVFRISDTQSLVSTVDMITPLVNDPYIFGKISAANSLSDVFAMGADVLYALNVVSIPPEMSATDVGLMYEGALEMVLQANAAIIGGHTLAQPILLYGLSVTGQVFNNEYFANDMASDNCTIYITKPLGGGILATCYKENLLNGHQYNEWVNAMTTLNMKACKVAKPYITTMTDITGFGLLGHAYEVCKASNIKAVFNFEAVPFFEGVKHFFDQGYSTGAAQRNLAHIKEYCFGKPEHLELLADPQTSGGMLLFVKKTDEAQFEKAFQMQSVTYHKVGYTCERTSDYIEVK